MQRYVHPILSLRAFTNKSQRALVGTPWKEYQAGEKPYWYNTETKETTWVMPDVVTNNLKTIHDSQPPQRAAATPT